MSDDKVLSTVKRNNKKNLVIIFLVRTEGGSNINHIIN